MKFEYYAFKVAPYLKTGTKPSFVLEKPDKSFIYFTLANPEDGSFSKTTSNSEAVRIPVFNIKTSVIAGDSSLEQLSHGSLLAAVGIEVTTRFIAKLSHTKNIQRVLIVLADECHELADKRYQVYFGLTVETRK
jgi:hypothetical protein